MNLPEAIILGLLQGLTEFLPVSSSGHLELGKYLFGIDPKTNFYFSVAVHGATVLSTIAVLRNEIASLFKGLLTFKLNEETKYLTKIVISMLPVAIVGLFVHRIEQRFFTGNMVSLGVNFFITACLLWLTVLIKPRERSISYLDSFIIGIAQAIAVLPGISRSGATISTGLIIGNKRSEIAKFSFLMVLVPVIGANVVELLEGDFSKSGTSLYIIAAGFLTAFITGYLACKWMISLVRRGSLAWFAVYCIIAGIFSILLGFNVF